PPGWGKHARKFYLWGVCGSGKLTNPLAATTPATTVSPGEQVNINTVDEAALIRGLNGVGEAKARAILEYRAAHGPFVSVDQLLEVKGVGPALLEKNRSRIVIE
ncbi:ComEA family DNA-binding protein, partial [Pseudomonas aeruginosa]|uniref:ComEA family DNA-binding protein n=1 Tax=Pseudomonas aeruginosa TaxID=287 RepID=UPI00384BC3E5